MRLQFAQSVAPAINDAEGEGEPANGETVYCMNAVVSLPRKAVLRNELWALHLPSLTLRKVNDGLRGDRKPPSPATNRTEGKPAGEGAGRAFSEKAALLNYKICCSEGELWTIKTTTTEYSPKAPNRILPLPAYRTPLLDVPSLWTLSLRSFLLGTRAKGDTRLTVSLGEEGRSLNIEDGLPGKKMLLARLLPRQF